MRVKFGGLEQTQGLHLPAKFHLNLFIVSAFRGHNPQFGANFDIWGLLYRPLSQMRAKFIALEQTYGIRLRVNFRLDRFILSPSGGEKNPEFWTSSLVVSPLGNYLRKLSTSAQLQTFLYPTASK